MEEIKSEQGAQPGQETKEEAVKQEAPQQVVEAKEEPAERGERKEEFGEIIARIERLETKTGKIEEELNRINEAVRELKEMMGSAAEYANTILDTAFKEKFSSAAREIEKLNEKLAMLMDEVGAGEGLNVAKIPPTILEIVYQSTLDDVVNAIFRQLGYAEAERRIAEVLEEIRERTSGSELFRFDGKRIRARDVAASIEKKLVSARQMQTTYDELLKKLLELVPGYKPKNFRAMIKLKSQEYSVDSTIRLTERVSELEKWAGKIENMVAQSDVRNAGALEALDHCQHRIEEIHKLIEKSVGTIQTKIEDTNLRLSGLEAEVESNRENLNREISELLERIRAIEEKLGLQHEKVEEKPVEEEGEGISEDESFLYYAVEPEKALEEVKNTLSLMFSNEKIEALVESLIKKGYIERYEKDGVVYLRRAVKEEKPELSLEEKIVAEMEDGFTFRKLQRRFKDVEKSALESALEKLIEEGKIYVEGTERRKIYRFSSQDLEEKKDGGV
ncbi:MAG: hypothetical protein QXD15_01615 [Thermoplasmata archaeon]